MIWSILQFLLGLSVLVLIHEFGHFLTAKRLGIKVEEFGFGFPPRVFGIRKGETLYSINLLPIGGFVKLFGEDNAGGGSLKGADKTLHRTQELKRAFFARPIWQRAVIILAGVIMNFVLAVGILSYLFAFPGVGVPTQNIKVVEVLSGSPAAQAGLHAGDQIISIENKDIKKTNDFIRETKKHVGQEIRLEVKRGDKTFSVTVTPRKEYPKGQGPMGIAISDIELRKYPLYIAPFFGTWEALKFSYLIIQGIVTTLTDLVLHGIKPAGVAGPVGVYQLSTQAAKYGINAWLWFISLISLNLAVLNVLPIPALDGGRLFFILIEAVTGRKVSQRHESFAHAVGLAVLLALMLLITFHDISRILSGKSLFPTP